MAGMTVAELVAKKFKDRFGKPLEVGKHADKNPLEVRIGGIITLDTADERDLFFTVKEIGHAIENIGGKEIPFTDYSIVATPGGDDGRVDDTGKVRRILRVLPVEEGDKYLQYNCVLLSQFYECDYNSAKIDNLYDRDFRPPTRGDWTWPVLQDPNGEFRDFGTGDQYYRRFRGYAGWEAPHIVSYTVLSDTDGNGRVDEDEVVEGRQVQFWDYERDFPLGSSGRSRTELLYVEQDSDGFFRLYKGRQVPQEMVTRL